MLFAFEDRRFYSHNGVDPFGIARAARDLVLKQRIVTGGSTLTMQVARLLDNQYKRTPSVKLRQIVRALQLEQQLTKKQILSLYLGLAPFGGRVKGVRAASLKYFGKEPQNLSIAEAALLVALPQAPEARRLDRDAEAAPPRPQLRPQDRHCRRCADTGRSPTRPTRTCRARAPRCPQPRR